MRTSQRTLGVIVVLLACTGNVLDGQETSDDVTHAQIRSVVERYSSALATGDSLTALSLLHPDVVIYEGGHAETFEQYRSGHLPSDIAFASAVKRTTTADHILVTGDAALYTSEYTAAGRFRDRDIDSHGTETMVLLRTPDGWKIRHIHWSSR
jgi:ketosteroid isomerase-like protein